MSTFARKEIAVAENESESSSGGETGARIDRPNAPQRTALTPTDPDTDGTETIGKSELPSAIKAGTKREREPTENTIRTVVTRSKSNCTSAQQQPSYEQAEVARERAEGARNAKKHRAKEPPVLSADPINPIDAQEPDEETSQVRQGEAEEAGDSSIENEELRAAELNRAEEDEATIDDEPDAESSDGESDEMASFIVPDDESLDDSNSFTASSTESESD
jgi:hypothetical protein